MKHLDDPPKGRFELVEHRRPVGIGFYERYPAKAYQIYEVTYDDLSTALVMGSILSTAPGITLAGEDWRKDKSIRPDLSDNINAASVLIKRVSNALWALDAPKKRAPSGSRTRASSLRKRRSATKPKGRNAKLLSMQKNEVEK